MTLTDTGPFVALICRTDAQHEDCVEAIKSLARGPLVTTWPCFTEAMHLLYRELGPPGQRELWQWRRDDRVRLHDLGHSEADRMAVLMDKYSDLPMDMADASLIAAAEHFGQRQIFTLDNDFRIYRFTDGGSVEVIP